MDKDLAKDFPEKKEDDKEDEIEMKKEVFINYLNFLLKFGPSAKGKKFQKVFHFKFDATEYCQIKSGRFFSNFVPLSERPNFKNCNCTFKRQKHYQEQKRLNLGQALPN